MRKIYDFWLLYALLQHTIELFLEIFTIMSIIIVKKYEYTLFFRIILSPGGRSFGDSKSYASGFFLCLPRICINLIRLLLYCIQNNVLD